MTAKDANNLEVTGNLTLHGVTKQVTIPVEVLGSVKTPNGEKAGFETNFTINRKDYGIVWNRVLDAGGSVLGDDVKINIGIEAPKMRKGHFIFGTMGATAFWTGIQIFISASKVKKRSGLPGSEISLDLSEPALIC